LDFDVAYTSKLKRAIKTLWIMLEDTDQMFIPVFGDWRLNERHYGALQGLDKIHPKCQDQIQRSLQICKKKVPIVNCFTPLQKGIF